MLSTATAAKRLKIRVNMNNKTNAHVKDQINTDKIDREVTSNSKELTIDEQLLLFSEIIVALLITDKTE